MFDYGCIVLKKISEDGITTVSERPEGVDPILQRLQSLEIVSSPSILLLYSIKLSALIDFVTTDEADTSISSG